VAVVVSNTVHSTLVLIVDRCPGGGATGGGAGSGKAGNWESRLHRPKGQ